MKSLDLIPDPIYRAIYLQYWYSPIEKVKEVLDRVCNNKDDHHVKLTWVLRRVLDDKSKQ